MSKIIQFCLILLFVIISQEGSAMVTKSFKVSVVEYYRKSAPIIVPAEVLAENSENMANIISKAADESVQLIVFPENSFSTHDVFSTSKTQTKVFASDVPEPEMKINLCQLKDSYRYRQELVKISCAAEQYRMYVVINVLEVYDTIVFSSNIVFDPTGLLIAKCKKDLYTGQQFDNKNCMFTAGAYKFALIMENNLLRPDLKDLIGDANGVIFTAHEAGSNTVFPSIAYYEMLAINNNIDNLLVSTFHDGERLLTGSGIFTPRRKSYIQSINIEESVLLSTDLEPNTRFKRHPLTNKNTLPRYLRSAEGFEIQKWEIKNHKYCSEDGLCCHITTLDKYIPKDFSVVIRNSTNDISKTPMYDKLKRRTMQTFNFCGIMYYNGHDELGTVPSSVIETPKVKIEITDDRMLPLTIGHELIYEMYDESKNKSVLEVTDSRNLLVIGFTHTFITYEREYPKTRRSKQSAQKMYNNNSCGCMSPAVMMIIFFVIIKLSTLH